MTDQDTQPADTLDTLRGFVNTLVDDTRDLDSLPGQVLFYGRFLRDILNAGRPGFRGQRQFYEPTRISSGDAITPWHAAACMEDRLRTAAFIRGAVKAVEHTLRMRPERPLHLVEAGCGPLGTLVLPLLARFGSEELEISIIDLHQESIDCMEIMLGHFGFLPRTRQLIVGDATQVCLETPVHIVLTETMHMALSQEPQVAISRALLSKNPSATLIPQSIRVDLALLDLATETSYFPPRVCERIPVAPVFELNRRTAVELPEDNGLLPAASVILPDPIPQGHTPCLTTTIQVFDDVVTGDYKTQISLPVPLHMQDRPIPPGTTIQFTYRMGEAPGLLGQFF